jgi:hypothetical protein
MAATPIPEANPNEVGTFVSSIAIGFVLASPEETARIAARLKTGSVTDMTRLFVDDLLAIKLLAPTESAGLLIHPVPMIQTFVRTLRQELVMNYYLQQGER